MLPTFVAADECFGRLDQRGFELGCPILELCLGLPDGEIDTLRRREVDPNARLVLGELDLRSPRHRDVL